MIGVLTLFGDTDLQPVLKKLFSQNDIFFIQENCITSVQLMTQLDEHGKETDVVIIYANAMNMEAFSDIVAEIRKADKLMRIVLVLNGSPGQYLRSILSEYKEMKVDLIFDDEGFDVEELLNLLKKGKLSHRDMKPRRSGSGFQDDIGEEEIRPKSKIAEKAENKKETAPDMSPESFSEPKCHFVVGVMNATHGAGATKTAYDLARYFAIQNYKTCLVDLSGACALKLVKLKNVDCYMDETNLDELRERYNIAVCDFGTPFDVSADGQNFKLESIYNPKNIQNFLSSDLKIIMGFADPWNIEKVKFFFINDSWRDKFDRSYLFVVPEGTEKLKSMYPESNFQKRDDDLRELILEVFRKEEKW